MKDSILLCCAVVMAMLFAADSASYASPVPDYDFEWVTIGDPGNAVFDRDVPPNPFFDLSPRGSVGYEYRMSRFEMTTGQWLEFVNTFSTQAVVDVAQVSVNNVNVNLLPSGWGAQRDLFDYDGPGDLYIYRPISNPGERPLGGVRWRAAAMYCNWLHNGKSGDVNSLLSGAYDTTTWGMDEGGRFTDDIRREDGAKFWIPSLDEWLKAVYYDPAKNGEGDDGWWLHSYSSDTPPVTGLPGAGATSAGLDLFPFSLPVGSYDGFESPWGLKDTSGGASEWVEDFPGMEIATSLPRDRYIMGDETGSDLGQDQIGRTQSRFVGSSAATLRIASAIPSTGTAAVLAIALPAVFRRRR